MTHIPADQPQHRDVPAAARGILADLDTTNVPPAFLAACRSAVKRDIPGPYRVKVEGDLLHGRVPDGAIYVGNRMWRLHSPYGNPFSRSKNKLPPVQAVQRYIRKILNDPRLLASACRDLPGSDLACWCDFDHVCHADVLLVIANTAIPLIFGR